MFQTGDKVVYGIHGVCDIKGTENQRMDGKNVAYLILEPIAQPGSRYLVPTHNPTAMGKIKKMLTRTEMEELIQSGSILQDCWIRDESQRKQLYRELISSGDRERIMAMVHTLYRHKAEQTASGRKVHLCDDNFLRDAEKLIAGEVAFVMGLSQDEARQFIRQKLK